MYDWSLAGSAPARMSGPVLVVRDAGVVAGGEPRGAERAARSSIASKRTRPLQRTHGLGVRPAASSSTKSSTTSLRKPSRTSSVTCGSPILCASARAPVTACGEQQLFVPSVPGSDHSSSVTAIASWPLSSASWAATALSTPPLIAISVRLGSGSSCGLVRPSAR